ncbi:Protein of unknown function [Bacillus mycoides]|nr:Protein of unknown function [Bacillus mycoides]
MHKMGAN